MACGVKMERSLVGTPCAFIASSYYDFGGIRSADAHCRPEQAR